MVARSVAEVIAGEAVHGAGRFQDMVAIASVVANRARSLGVTPQQVVANQREFNAYGKALPKGANRYVEMAERAIRQVQEQGPTHRGTFYATPSATRNLPRGLSQVAQTSGHVYYSDPQRRPINTAVGTKRYQDKPTATAYAPHPTPTGALAAINSITQPSRTPTPTARPQVQGPNRPAVDASRFGTAAPAMTQDMHNSLAERYGTKGGRVPSPAVSASTIARPSVRPTPPQSLTPTQERNLASRLSPQTSLAMAPRPTAAPRAVSAPAPDGVIRAASLPIGLQSARGARVAPATVSRSAPLTTKQAVNLASRLSPMQATPQAAALRAARPAASPVSVGSLLGISPAAASTRTPTTATANATPARTNFAGSAGSIRSMDARQVTAPAATTNLAGAAGSPRSVDARIKAQIRSVNPMVSQAPRPATVTPATRPNFAGPIGSPRAVEGQVRAVSLASSPVQGPVRPQVQGPMRPATPQLGARVVSPVPANIATPTARPTISAPQTISSRPATRAVSVAAAPQAVRSAPTPTARDPWGNLRTSVAAAPAAPATGLASRLGITPSRVAGSVIGGAIAGPIGAIAGGFLGGRIGTAVANRPSLGGGGMNNASSTNGFGGGGMNGMGGNQGSSLNGAGIGGGNRDRFGGFAGFSGDSSSTPGRDGGKVGGGSRSSSSSGGKSSSGKGKK